MGKPNSAKLANFPEVEVFVLVADPEGAILDSKVGETSGCVFAADCCMPQSLQCALLRAVHGGTDIDQARRQSVSRSS